MAEPSSSSKTWQVSFRSGVEKLVSDAQAKQIDDLYVAYKATKVAGMMRFKDGTRVSIADLEAIVPIENDGFSEKSVATFGKLAGYISAASDKHASDHEIADRKRWIEIIRENQRRAAKGEPWLYYEQTPNGIILSTKERLAEKVAAVKAAQYEALAK